MKTVLAADLSDGALLATTLVNQAAAEFDAQSLALEKLAKFDKMKEQNRLLYNQVLQRTSTTRPLRQHKACVVPNLSYALLRVVPASRDVEN